MVEPRRDGATLLQLYFAKHGLNQRSFARLAGVPSTTVNRAINRVRAMDIYSAAKIEKATDGFVPAASWALVKLRQGGGRKAA